tara:strand:- start:412 stop:939 length:528 start_codon:yes stop_codon:yes gene_type:complete
MGCESILNRDKEYKSIDLELAVNLPIDENGNYHLELIQTWQTIKRLTANLKSDEYNDDNYWERDLIETIKVYWQSSHYWLLNDTLGYIIKRGLTDEMQYVNYDTIYVTGFEDMVVPTINSASYPKKINTGVYEVNSVIAPIRTMIGDTIKVWIYYWDLNYDYNEYSFDIIVDDNQ